jgi:hypothetical protein
MQLHTKKKYADAIAHFTIATQKAPEVAMYATNLLSAQAMAGKLDDADKTIATYAPRNIPWFVWRLAVDPELKAVAKRPSAKLGAAKPGTAKSKLNQTFTKKDHDEIAYSPLGIAAAEVNMPVWYDGGPDGDYGYEIVFVDMKTGAELMRLPTGTECLRIGRSAHDTSCGKQMAAAEKAQRAVVDQLFQQLGFAIVTDAQPTEKDDQLIAKDGRIVVFGEHPRVIRGKQERPLVVPDRGGIGAVRTWFVPGGLVFVTHVRKEVDDCAGGGSSRDYVSAVETP